MCNMSSQTKRPKLPAFGKSTKVKPKLFAKWGK